MKKRKIKTNYYQQFSADYSLDVPGEGYGGWRQGEIELDFERTAVVMMHAWHCRSYDEYPGEWKAVEYLPRAEAICREQFPRLRAALKQANVKLFHVVGGGNYYSGLPGYKKAAAVPGQAEPACEQIESDDSLAALRAFRAKHVSLGDENRLDVQRFFDKLDFADEARPEGDEYVAENREQLFAFCKETGVNHLIYIGFAINWCLLLSPGGMADMSKHAIMCSAIRQATTAVENKETARRQSAKEIGLWRVAIAFGFVFDIDDFIAGLGGLA